MCDVGATYTKTRRYCPSCGLRTVWAACTGVNTFVAAAYTQLPNLDISSRLEQLLCTSCGSAFMATDSRKVKDCDPAVQRAYEAACRAEQRQQRNRAEQSDRRLAERKRRGKSSGKI